MTGDISTDHKSIILIGILLPLNWKKKQRLAIASIHNTLIMNIRDNHEYGLKIKYQVYLRNTVIVIDFCTLILYIKYE